MPVLFRDFTIDDCIGGGEMIVLDQISFQFASQDRPTLQIDHLEIEEGQCVVLCGASGSGKTCTTRLLNGLIPEVYEGCFTGKAKLGQLDLGKTSVEDLACRVASVFQNPATQFFHRKVEHELVFPCENLGLESQEICQRLDQISQFFGLTALMEQDLMTASGGERQRIALATATMQAPKVLVLDEPTANLDQTGVAQVSQKLKELKALGVTLVIAEHRLDFLQEIADKYVYFKDGKMLREWSRTEWLNLSNQDRAAYGLRGINLASDPWALSCLPSEGLSLRNLHLKTSKVDLGPILDMDFAKGRITALVGPNGLGKSTLARILSGLEAAKGEIFYQGQLLSDRDRLSMTALVMQEVRLQLFAATVRDEILLGAIDLEKFDDVVTRLRLSHLLDRHPMSLSGGEQQRVLIANALLSDKKILIFDEPTSGLDYQQMKAFSDLLEELRSADRVIIVITHDWELINQVCQEVRTLDFK